MRVAVNAVRPGSTRESQEWGFTLVTLWPDHHCQPPRIPGNRPWRHFGESVTVVVVVCGVCQPLRGPYQRTLGRGPWCRKDPLLTWWKAAQGKWGKTLMRRSQRGPLGLGQPGATLGRKWRQVRLFVLSIQKLCLRAQSSFVIMLPAALQQWPKCFFLFLFLFAFYKDTQNSHDEHCKQSTSSVP